MLRERSKNFLALHVILGGGILGITLAIVGLLLNFTNIFLTFEDYIGLFTIIQVSQLKHIPHWMPKSDKFFSLSCLLSI